MPAKSSTTKRRAARNTKGSLEAKLKQRGMSDAQVAAFAKNARRHQGAEDETKGKTTARLVVRQNSKPTQRRKTSASTSRKGK